MKYSKLLLSSSSPKYIYIAVISLLTICIAITGGNNVLWGVPYVESLSELPFKTFLKWHMLTMPPLLFASDFLNNIQIMEILIRIRIKKDSKLQQFQITTCLIVSILWGTTLALLNIFLYPVEDAVGAVLVTALGYAMWMCLYLYLYYLSLSVSVALIGTILSVASIFYIGEITCPGCSLVITSWSMVSRSSIFCECGVSVGLALCGSTAMIIIYILASRFINQRRRKIL